MARVSKVDACMFCGNAPCTCNAKAKPEPKPRAPRKKALAKNDTPVESPVTEVPGPIVKTAAIPSIHEAMRAAAKTQTAPRTERQIEQDEMNALADIASDPLMSAAIRNLGPILDRTEVVRYKHILAAEPSLEDRKAVWKARRDVVE